MSYIEAIFLGLVQGLGEFLPISSSAHLVIAPWFFDFKDPGLAFDVALHLGTLVAVIIYFWQDWVNLTIRPVKHVLKKEDEDGQNKMYFNLLIYLIVATIPGAVAGLLIKDFAEHNLRNPMLVAINMILLGALLMWADKKFRSEDEGLKSVTLKMAMIIGFSQALALFPGVSRSGITITTALFLGFSRTTAARFSFLMSTPIILGACVLKGRFIIEAFQNPQALMGIVTSAIIGFLCIKYLIKYVQFKSYNIFSYYRFVFGIVVMTMYLYR